MENWSRAEKLALLGVILAIIGIAFFFPQVKGLFGIDKPDVVLCLYTIDNKGLVGLGMTDVEFGFDLFNRGSTATTVTEVHFDISHPPLFGSTVDSHDNYLSSRQDIDAGKLSPTIDLDYTILGGKSAITDVSTFVYWAGGQGTPFQNMHDGTITNPSGCP